MSQKILTHSTSKPEYKITKIIKSILMIAVIATSASYAHTPSFATSFNDVENHWAKSYIETASTYNAISGYTDGTFKPNAKIKRIEFIAIIVNSQGIDVRSPEKDEYWGQPFIEAALKSGLILSDEYGDLDELTFDQNISREEMASIVVNAYIYSGRLVEPTAMNEVSSKLTDLDTVSPRYYNRAIESVALGFISGDSNGTFSPKEHATRAQAAVLSYKLLAKLGVLTDEVLPENIVLSKTSINQGDLLKITLYHVTDTSAITLIQDLYPSFKWYDTGTSGVLEGYIPTNYSTTPGKHTLKIVNAVTGNTSTQTIVVTQRNFRVQNLTIDPGVESSTKTDEAYAQYRKYFNPSREVSSPIKYYTESFLLPVKGKLTTEFGESRIVNNALTTYRHAGIDIAAPRNTDVLATNTGKVMLAMHLTITGNSIVIDHGEGLFSVYFHLDKLFVNEGDLVTRGQRIGAVGSTGFSTGPHLHFTMSYYRFDIEPGFILYGESITKQNYLELMK